MIHHGDAIEVMRGFAPGCFDCAIADPTYADTSLAWDVLVDGWVDEVSRVLKPNGSLWVFGSLRSLPRVFADAERAGFKYSQDIVWEKQNGTGFHNDRFRRVHEHAVLFYRGAWANVYHATQYTLDATAKTVRRKTRPTHTGNIEAGHYVSEDGGPRMMRSVLYHRNEHGKAVHPTQKPIELLRPMIRYSTPPGGKVLDLFSGSGSTSVAALLEGCEPTAIEQSAEYVEIACARIAHEMMKRYSK